MFSIFFVLGGVCSTLIPLTYGTQKASVGALFAAQPWRSARAQPAPPHARAGRYLSSPLSGKTAEQLHNTPPDELGFNDLPPAVSVSHALVLCFFPRALRPRAHTTCRSRPQVIIIGAAIISSSMLSCVIQKLEFPEQPTLLGDTVHAIVAFVVGAAALAGAAQMLLENESDPAQEQVKVVGGVLAGSMLVTPVWFFSSGKYDKGKDGGGGQQL